MTALAVPAAHKFALGAVPVGGLIALPHAPFTGISVKLAITVQSATTALVVKVVPTSAPPHVPPTEAE